MQINDKVVLKNASFHMIIKEFVDFTVGENSVPGVLCEWENCGIKSQGIFNINDIIINQ